MKANIKTQYSQQEFFTLFERFIRESSKGKRLKKDGRKLRRNTIDSYVSCLRLLRMFASHKGFEIKLFKITSLSPKELKQVKEYWKSFYKAFTDHMYYECDYYDNYVGTVIKTLRTFLNYLNEERVLNIGTFHKQFYAPHEEVPIVVLTPQHMHYLIYDPEFNEKLSPRLRIVKDIFIFGCTVALRVSDIRNLTPENLHYYNNGCYLKVRSIKTGIQTSIRLPDYAVEIVERYKGKNPRLFPSYSRTDFNRDLKEIVRLMNLTTIMIKWRSKRGEKLMVYKNKVKKQHYTLADHVSSHTMRRTGITTLITLGVPIDVVRKISGHRPNSKEFFRYVDYAPQYMDAHTEEAFGKLKDIDNKNNF